MTPQPPVLKPLRECLAWQSVPDQSSGLPEIDPLEIVGV